MKNSQNQSRITGYSIILTLSLLVASIPSFSTPNTGKDYAATVLDAAVEEFSFIEISEEKFLVDERPEMIMFFDDENELVYKIEDQKEREFQVEILLRKSDLLMEFDGVKYYHVN